MNNVIFGIFNELRKVQSRLKFLYFNHFLHFFHFQNAFNNDDLVLYSASRLIESLQSSSSSGGGSKVDHTPQSLAEMLQQAGEKEVSAKGIHFLFINKLKLIFLNYFYLTCLNLTDEFIYREVVLVTDDLDLRLKALCFEVPVKKLTHFLKWAKVKDPKKKVEGEMK